MAMDGAKPLEIKCQARFAEESVKKRANLLPFQDPKDGIAVCDVVAALHKGQTVNTAVGGQHTAFPGMLGIEDGTHVVQVLQDTAASFQHLGGEPGEAKDECVRSAQLADGSRRVREDDAIDQIVKAWGVKRFWAGVVVHSPGARSTQ